jgi:hypothetical protein
VGVTGTGEVNFKMGDKWRREGLKLEPWMKELVD